MRTVIPRMSRAVCTQNSVTIANREPQAGVSADRRISAANQRLVLELNGEVIAAPLAQTDGVINLVSALFGIRHLLPTRRAGNFFAWIILSTW